LKVFLFPPSSTTTFPLQDPCWTTSGRGGAAELLRDVVGRPGPRVSGWTESRSSRRCVTVGAAPQLTLCCPLSWEKGLWEKLHITSRGSFVTAGKSFPLVLVVELGLITLMDFCNHPDVSSLQTTRRSRCNRTATVVHLFHCLCHPELYSYSLL